MEPKKYIVEDHYTGIKYEVTEHEEPKTEPVKQPIDYTKEVKRLYAKEFPNENERDKQLERDALQWKQYYKDNQGKIPDEFPKTIFDDKKVKR